MKFLMTCAASALLISATAMAGDTWRFQDVFSGERVEYDFLEKKIRLGHKSVSPTEIGCEKFPEYRFCLSGPFGYSIFVPKETRAGLMWKEGGASHEYIGSRRYTFFGCQFDADVIDVKWRFSEDELPAVKRYIYSHDHGILAILVHDGERKYDRRGYFFSTAVLLRENAQKCDGNI